MMMENNDNSKNAFIRKCFDRVYGLVAIIVSDQEGAILLKGVSPNISQLTNGQVSDFDGTFPATFLLASEQASKLPYGKNEHTISCYENYVIVQMDTSEPISTTTPSSQQNHNIALSSSNVSSSALEHMNNSNHNSNSNSSNMNNNNKRIVDESDGGNDQEEDQDLLTITLIATSEASIQLLLNLGPSLKQIFNNL